MFVSPAGPVWKTAARPAPGRGHRRRPRVSRAIHDSEGRDAPSWPNWRRRSVGRERLSLQDEGPPLDAAHVPERGRAPSMILLLAAAAGAREYSRTWLSWRET